MALEKFLWGRCRTGLKNLRKLGHKAHFCRLENSAGEGNPDVEGVIDGAQCWIELKSCERPKRATTMIRPKTQESQSIWHNERTAAGSRIHWVLMQVGEAQTARLYLIPGSHYDAITATEDDLDMMSVIDATADMVQVLLRAVKGW
jgi:hypothetical protein